MRVFLLIACLLCCASRVSAQPYEPGAPLSDWQLEKCRIYEQSWGEALAFFGSDNVNYNFIAQNENFIAGRCTGGIQICPQSNQELEIANALTLVMMNAGAASTFLPFSCPATD